jgi:prepilin-type N-terminal cleavage/methylation domain-containing protein
MKKGFTLIEILIVVVIIGILASVALTVIQPDVLYSRARDSRRQTDLKTLQTGLENYYAENRSYPYPGNTDWVSTASGAFLHGALVTGGTTYLNNYPFDPVSSKTYYYSSNGSKYCVVAITENDVTDSSRLCTALRNNSATLCNTAGVTGYDPEKCLGAENPF